MGTVIAIVVVLVIVVAVVALLLNRRGSAASAPVAGGDPTPAPKVRPPEKPMDGLESALAAATDRDGRPMSERIDAEAGQVDELRVPDDTGPLLRRALDHVTPADAASADQEATAHEASDPPTDDASDERAG